MAVREELAVDLGVALGSVVVVRVQAVGPLDEVVQGVLVVEVGAVERVRVQVGRSGVLVGFPHRVGLGRFGPLVHFGFGCLVFLGRPLLTDRDRQMHWLK